MKIKRWQIYGGLVLITLILVSIPALIWIDRTILAEKAADRALTALQAKDYQAADAQTTIALRKFASTSTRRKSMYFLRASARMDLGQLPEALADANSGLTIDSESSLGLHVRGQVYYKLEKYDEALADLQKAVGAKNPPKLAEYWLAMTRERRKEYAAAREHFTNVYKAIPEFTPALVGAYRCSVLLNELDVSETYLRAIRKSDPTLRLDIE